MGPKIDNDSSSRAKLIQATIRLMSSRGFEAMGIHSILEAADVSKSNFYYHFKSKEELCLAALDEMMDGFFTELLDPILAQKSLSPRKRLEKLIRSMSDMIESHGCQGGCPFTNLAAETSDFIPAFRERISSFFERYRQRLAQCFREGVVGVQTEVLSGSLRYLESPAVVDRISGCRDWAGCFTWTRYISCTNRPSARTLPPLAKKSSTGVSRILAATPNASSVPVA